MGYYSYRTTSMSESILRIKVISMGPPKAGKSCLIKRYCEKRFVSKYMATLGIDFGVTVIDINGHKIKVNIFDMGGESFFYEVRNEFYKGTHGALLVYDVTDRTSFEKLSDWLSEMNSHMTKEEADSVVIVVCANKIDGSHRLVTEAEGKLWAESRGFFYFETSAMTSENVIAMFECLFKRVVSVITENVPPRIPLDGPSYTNEQLSQVERVINSKKSIDILGVDPRSSRDEIIKAYKHLAVLLHPDKNSVPGSEEAFKKLCRAKDELLNKH